MIRATKETEAGRRFVLKGGVILASLYARRPTRDTDLVAHGVENSAEHVLLLVRNRNCLRISGYLVPECGWLCMTGRMGVSSCPRLRQIARPL